MHYTAAHYFDPNRAAFQDFEPLWEFVSGPIHAGTFGPNVLDKTFGPEVVFQKAPPPGPTALPPSDGLQFFATGKIDGKTDLLTMSIHDLNGKVLHKLDIEPAV